MVLSDEELSELRLSPLPSRLGLVLVAESFYAYPNSK